MGSKEGQDESTRVSLRGLNENSRPDPVSTVKTFLPLKCIPITTGELSVPPDHKGWCRFLPRHVLEWPLHAAASHSHGYLISMIDFHQETKGHVQFVQFAVENPPFTAGGERPIMPLMGLGSLF